MAVIWQRLKINKAVGFNNYSVFSLWDTFIAPPSSLRHHRSCTSDFIKTFLHNINKVDVSVWELAANETDTMIGYHSVN